MSYTLKLETDEEAIEAAKSYNEEGWNIVENSIKSGEIKTAYGVRFLLEFAGIQGRPAEALIRKYNLPELKKYKETNEND